MNDLDSRVLAHLKQTATRWQPKTVALALGAKAEKIGISLRKLADRKLITREPLPGHNQNAYYCTGAQGANAQSDDTQTTAQMSRVYKSDRVIWSYDERNLVLIETHRLLNETRGFSFRQALFEAQKLLPIARQRSTLSSKLARTLRAQYEAMPKLDTPPPAKDHADNDIDANMLDEPLMTAANDAEPTGFAVPPADPLGEMLQRLIDAITTNIADQLLDTLTTRINQSLSRLSSGTPAVVAPPPPPQVPKFRFVVVGLKGAQKTEIQSALPKTAQVSFWGVDEAPHQLKAICHNANRIFMMTKFVSHSHENIIRSIASDRLVRVNGGVTTLRDQIQQSIRMQG